MVTQTKFALITVKNTFIENVQWGNSGECGSSVFEQRKKSPSLASSISCPHVRSIASFHEPGQAATEGLCKQVTPPSISGPCASIPLEKTNLFSSASSHSCCLWSSNDQDLDEHSEPGVGAEVSLTPVSSVQDHVTDEGVKPREHGPLSSSFRADMITHASVQVDVSEFTACSTMSAKGL